MEDEKQRKDKQQKSERRREKEKTINNIREKVRSNEGMERIKERKNTRERES